MCFYNDYDWTAELVEETDETADCPFRCDECHRTLPVGEPIHRIFMQEYDECRDCFNGECQCVGECCQCETPTFGETFRYKRCGDCDKFLYAVQLAEEDAGCERQEARPSLGGMTVEIRDGGRDDAKRYWKKARQEYPGLGASGYLGWLWRQTFG